MMKKKQENEKKKVISISITPILYNFLNEETSNKSAYINRIMLDELNKLGLNLKIKL